MLAVVRHQVVFTAPELLFSTVDHDLRTILLAVLAEMDDRIQCELSNDAGLTDASDFFAGLTREVDDRGVTAVDAVVRVAQWSGHPNVIAPSHLLPHLRLLWSRRQMIAQQSDSPAVNVEP